MAVNFKLVSDFQTVSRRSFDFADSTLLDPNSATPVVMGEFLELNAAYKMARGTVNPAIVASYAYFAEQGRSDTQALGKGPFLYMNNYEADTMIMDPTGLTLGGALEVANVVVGGKTYRGLKIRTTGLTVGRITRLPASNNNYLRFIWSNS